MTNLYIGNFNGGQRSDFIRQSKFNSGDTALSLGAETASIGFQASDRSMWVEGGAAKFGDQFTLQISRNFQAGASQPVGRWKNFSDTAELTGILHHSRQLP